MYFPETIRIKLQNRKPCNHEMVNFLVDKICLKYGTLPIKVVIGMKLFKRQQIEIKKNIESSTHFR